METPIDCKPERNKEPGETKVIPSSQLKEAQYIYKKNLLRGAMAATLAITAMMSMKSENFALNAAALISFFIECVIDSRFKLEIMILVSITVTKSLPLTLVGYVSCYPRQNCSLRMSSRKTA